MNCHICKGDFSSEPDKLYYCLCDTSVCPNCINSVKKNNTTWICPACKAENDVEKSMLFRTS